MKKYKLSVTKEKEALLEVPFVYLAKDEMAVDPWNMSPFLSFI